MAVTKDELIDFHRFALAKLGNGGEDWSWGKLVGLWRLEHPSRVDQAEIDDAVREGLDDIAAGRFSPANDVMNELRAKHNIANE